MSDSDGVPQDSGGIRLESGRDFDFMRLQQEKELKEKELALRERELHAQRSARPTAWSTPAVVAIVGGLLGYMGTLISSCQNRQLERDKHEATLILEAIKTNGSALEKEKQTAANLVFLADAGLITTIRPTDLEKLRTKAQGAGPSLPSVQGVEFDRSSLLTTDLQSKLQTALASYERFLTQIGYDASTNRRVTVRIDEEDPNNAYFDNENVVIGRNLAVDPEYAISEYTWYVLKQANPAAFQIMWESPTIHAAGFAQGLKFYLACSHLNEPYIGRNFYSLSGLGERKEHQGYLYNLSAFRRFVENGPVEARQPHKLGEVWGGALWEIRSTLGREQADRLVLDAWKRLAGAPPDFGKASFYIDAFVATAQPMGTKPAAIVRQAFERRGLR